MLSYRLDVSGTWFPLESLVHGTVKRNFITTESTRSINPHLVDLWYGSEVFGIEVLRVSEAESDKQETWLRGYVRARSPQDSLVASQVGADVSLAR